MSCLKFDNLSSLGEKAVYLDDLVQNKTDIMQPSLDVILAYKNQHIIDGLMSALEISPEIASQLFEDGLLWLWYCNNHASEGYRDIDDPILIVDEVWHTFILYTPYYTKFCTTFFGEYLHHMPTLLKDNVPQSDNSQEDYFTRKKKQLVIIYELLGRDVFTRWYHTYPNTFSREQILAIRKR
jgi:hypothetical protein